MCLIFTKRNTNILKPKFYTSLKFSRNVTITNVLMLPNIVMKKLKKLNLLKTISRFFSKTKSLYKAER